jgi:hypothetical protein
MKQVNIIIVSLLTFFLLATIWGCKETKTSQSLINGTWEFATAGECTITSPTTDQGMPFTVTLSTANQMGIPTTTFTQGEPISITVTLTNTSHQIQWVWLSDCYNPPARITIIDTSGNTVTGVNLEASPCCTLPTERVTGGISFSLSSNACAVVWNTTFQQTLPVGSYKVISSFIGFMTSGFCGGCPSNISNYTALPLPPSEPVSLIIK